MPNNILRFLALTLLSPVALLANLEAEFAKAASIINSVERLAAYDKLAQKYKLAPSSHTENKIEGKWIVSTNTSPIDDSKTVTCLLVSDTEYMVGLKTIRPSLFVRYQEGELSVFINCGLFLGTDDISVTHRFGKGSAETSDWVISSNREAAFYKGDMGEFINALTTSDSLIVRMTPYGESPVTMSFSLSGFGKVRETLRATLVSERNEASKPKDRAR